ncbi:uncharacterized protein BDZ99DRAFT_517495 [Mytilinidion resinicola]|uniref:Uncharacterized protein n=1 Tax=Mytilinidion resinicola TaxID=574789 RepID=A0A6A6YZ60_9PEZI|nr:uncharacterized protein BDZ99DRAFT_517495 [Mytilinidion resinicola]KAF2813215.1 hypothetical protein BDZ99DRAFT_517495 [Mytilinidion resinicola]
MAVAFRFSDRSPRRRSRLHTTHRGQAESSAAGQKYTALSRWPRYRESLETAAAARLCAALPPSRKSRNTNSPHGDGRPSAERRPGITRVAGSTVGQTARDLSQRARAPHDSQPGRCPNEAVPRPRSTPAGGFSQATPLPPGLLPHFKMKQRIPTAGLAERLPQGPVREREGRAALRQHHV